MTHHADSPRALLKHIADENPNATGREIRKLFMAAVRDNPAYRDAVDDPVEQRGTVH